MTLISNKIVKNICKLSKSRIQEGSSALLTLGSPESNEMVDKVISGSGKEYMELVTAIEALSSEKLIDLLLILQLGRDDFSVNSMEELSDRRDGIRNFVDEGTVGYLSAKKHLHKYLLSGLKKIDDLR